MKIFPTLVGMHVIIGAVAGAYLNHKAATPTALPLSAHRGRASVDQSCDAHKAELTQAMDEAEVLLSITKYHLSDANLLKQYFGNYGNATPNPVETIKQMSLYDASYASSGQPRESCSDPLDQSVVAFCDNFWNYVGLDEVCNTVEADEGWVKAGIIIHELSHQIADTSDICYGMSCVLDLAANNASAAINNADNYHFFSLAAYALNTTGDANCTATEIPQQEA
ncbi:hypothetical protein J056_003730 [Wallemia ichthyophaga EXF-994]|uniref:Lysine-specific metallo-endopeptidase domain-containing protein n=1 Tax=Wallemia ichthyophaga (strain EXF-994 / CBS 113033) TaxID=1299270 RepID=R9AIL9_WALI9|nr:uncharacterized protein J056_003730 [Wallemia ichthyophaga EXF-994]EOR02054.1 hypothetical protein J056_003730 [Wallemia ichthyophaga EXF-994]